MILECFADVQANNMMSKSVKALPSFPGQTPRADTTIIVNSSMLRLLCM